MTTEGEAEGGPRTTGAAVSAVEPGPKVPDPAAEGSDQPSRCRAPSVRATMKFALPPTYHSLNTASNLRDIRTDGGAKCLKGLGGLAPQVGFELS